MPYILEVWYVIVLLLVPLAIFSLLCQIMCAPMHVDKPPLFDSIESTYKVQKLLNQLSE